MAMGKLTSIHRSALESGVGVRWGTKSNTSIKRWPHTQDQKRLWRYRNMLLQESQVLCRLPPNKGGRGGNWKNTEKSVFYTVESVRECLRHLHNSGKSNNFLYISECSVYPESTSKSVSCPEINSSQLLQIISKIFNNRWVAEDENDDGAL